MKVVRLSALLFVLLSFPLVILAQPVITTVAEINVVNDLGEPIFHGITTMERFTVEGVALNDSHIFNTRTPDGQVGTDYIIFVQDETGGIQVYSGGWYGGGIGNYPEVKEGDRVRVIGLTGFYGGKTNLNERHNPDQKFEVEILASGALPEPYVIHNLAEALLFDPTRQSGGEFYQGRLVTLQHVRLVEGDWSADSILTVEDSYRNRMPIQIWYMTGTAEHPMPEGWLNITGIFNQEDTSLPYDEGYILWPRSIEDFQPAQGSYVEDWHVYQ